MDAVASSTIAILYGTAAEPRIDAVEDAETLRVEMPKTPIKKGRIVAVCFTCMALAFMGAIQGIPTSVKLARHTAFGYPDII